MMRSLVAGFGLILATAAHAGEVDVRISDAGRVSLRVTSAPLPEILDRLARQTGMKVIYDGAPPRTVVRGRQVDNATPADAVANVLEGLGVSYALRLDATGAKVDTLLVLGATKSASAGSPTVPRPSAPAVRVPGLPMPLQPEEPDDEASVVEEAEDASEDARPTGRVDEQREGLRRPAPPISMPGMPGLPTGPVGPLTMPTPVPTPAQPTPPSD
jgi:hypothetical protein